MSALDILRREHGIIRRALDMARGLARRMQEGERPDAARLDDLRDFFHTFADAMHQGKEERYLFPRLAERGLPSRNGPLAVMAQEHEEGRQRLAGLAADMEQAQASRGTEMVRVAGDLIGYADLLQAHLDKEEMILFPLADRVLPESDQQNLAEDFSDWEATVMGPEGQERFLRLAQECGTG